MRGLARTIPQRLGMLVAAVASICLVAYPAPAFYRWSESESGWYRTNPPPPRIGYPWRPEHERIRKELLVRRSLLEYDMWIYGSVRPDFRRMGLEIAFAWLIGIGFAWAVKPRLG